MMLSCAIGGDPAVAELVQNLGAEGAWAKIIEGVLGEPAAEAPRVGVDVFERLAKAAAARFVVPGDEEWPAGLDDLRHAEHPAARWRAVRPVAPRSGTSRSPDGTVGRDRGLTGGNGVRERHRSRPGGRSGRAGGDRAVWWCLRHRYRGASRGTCRRRTDRLRARERRRRGLSARPRLDLRNPGKGPATRLRAAAGAHPRVRFLARNRLIAAMSRGTVVVEAALRSGARNTAGWALGCGRPLMAVPGPVYSRASTAPHLMIRNGQACWSPRRRRSWS